MEEEDPRRVVRWMSKDLLTTHPEATLRDALEIMEDRRIRHLPVLKDERLVGLISDRDTRRCVEVGKPTSLDDTAVRDVMTAAAKLHVVEPSTLVRDAAELICRNKVSALPVVQGDKLLGITTSEDLLWALLETTAE